MMAVTTSGAEERADRVVCEQNTRRTHNDLHAGTTGAVPLTEQPSTVTGTGPEANAAEQVSDAPICEGIRREDALEKRRYTLQEKVTY